MSDELDITHGGAIAVDTDELRRIAAGMGSVAELIGEAAEAIRRAYRVIVDAPGFTRYVDTVALWSGADRADAVQAETREACEGTALMADVYEYVELRAELDALAVSNEAAVPAMQMRLDQLELSDERIPGMADMLIAGWEDARFDGLDSQFDLSRVVPWLGLGPVVGLTAQIGTQGGLGTIAPGTVLRGSADPVAVRPVQVSHPPAPPASIADAFRRFPSSDGAQLKVERYTMADGSRKFVLYAKGTQSGWYGASNPWDMKSNHELYAKETSASYQATLDALEAAGAKPGDVVNVYAHSQAGMIGAHLSMQSEFDVQVQVTAGSPVEPTLRDDQLLIQLRHTDDLVASLAGGGSPGGTGSPDSFVAQRVGDPAKGAADLALVTHHIETYIETAEMVDASGDVRLEAIQQSYAELADAVEIEATEYRADRTGWAG